MLVLRYGQVKEACWSRGCGPAMSRFLFRIFVHMLIRIMYAGKCHAPWIVREMEKKIDYDNRWKIPEEAPARIDN